MAPYRTVTRDEHAEAPGDAGIVGDIISQFTDPLAFYRELVQNAIDAGSSSIDIVLTYDTDVVRVAVRDRGEGMTRDILENQLLVLFRSTKEQDRTKIGKFGIGFASVLAPSPRLVVVNTVRDGRRLMLHLHPDLTYQLFDGGPATQTGTTVELELPMNPELAEAFARRSHDALVRWCRHATVPIRFTAEEPRIAARIDGPLALEHALVEVRGVTDDGALTAIVGITAEARPYAGFFNHGLMLHETTEPLLGGLAVKIQDARLGHTLSRDNVRRDESFQRAVAYARSLAGEALPEAVARALVAAAEADDPVRQGELVRAVAASGLELPARTWRFLLVEPFDGRRFIAGDQLAGRVYVADGPSRLTAALAAAQTPILRVGRGDTWLLAHLRAVTGSHVLDLERELTLVSPLAESAADSWLLTTLGELLLSCNGAGGVIRLVDLAGAHRDALAIAGSKEALDAASPYVLERGATTGNPFTRPRSTTLLLRADHPVVHAARNATDHGVAVAHLARAILLHYELLDVRRSEVIIRRALATLGLGADGDAA